MTVAIRRPSPSRPAPRRRDARRGLAVLAGLAALGTALACSNSSTQAEGASGPPPVTVQLVTATPTDLPVTRSAVASLASPEMTTVASEISGTVLAVDIPEGQTVERGHVLARLDDAEARASLAVTRARLRNARDRLTRLESLRAQSVSSQQAYEDALSEFDAARGAFEEAETRLDKTTIRAPFAGVLGLRQLNVGQYVSPGSPVVEITQVHPLELHFSLPQRFRPELALDQTVIGIVGRCGPRFEGTVQAIDPRVDPATRTVRLHATVPNPDGSLHPGMAARVRLVVGRVPEALVVPQEAIVRQGTKHIVYTVDEQGTATSHEVSLGEFFADGVHVASGIEAGARVVVAGQQKLRPGSATEAVPHQPTRNPNLDLGRFGPLSDCEHRS